MMCYVIVLMGGVVVGKSVVIWCFEVCGIYVYDVDVVVCEVIELGM